MIPYSGFLSLIAGKYVSAGNFRGRKLLRICEKYDFRGENFCGLLVFAAPKNVTSPNFAKKLL